METSIQKLLQLPRDINWENGDAFRLTVDAFSTNATINDFLLSRGYYHEIH